MNHGAKHVPFPVPQERLVGIAVPNTDANTSRTGVFRQVGADAPGDERCRTRTVIRRCKVGLKTGEDVVFVKAGARKHLAVMYRATDVFVVASHYEEFDTRALKPMAAGTPVVVSNHGPLPEAANDAVLFADPTAANLTDAMQRTISDASTRAESSRAATFMRSASAESHSEIVGEVFTRSAPGPMES